MNKIKNPKTNRFVKIDSVLGMKLLNEMNQKINQQHLIQKKIIGKGGYGVFFFKKKKYLIKMENYKISIRKVLRQLHPDCNITDEAKTNINLILNVLLIKLVNQSKKFMKPEKSEKGGKTLSVLELEKAVKLIIPNERQANKFATSAEYAISVGKNIVSKFKKNEKMKGTLEKKAGLQFSVSKTRKVMRDLLSKDDNLSEYAPVYASAVLEYICAEFLEHAGHVAYNKKRKTINTIFLKTYILNNPELKHLITGTLKISFKGEIGVFTNLTNQKFKYTQSTKL